MESRTIKYPCIRLATLCSVLFLLLAISCSSKKYLQAEEHLVKKNIVTIEGEGIAKKEKSRLKELAEAAIPLKPNTKRMIFFPKERAALKYRFEADTPGLDATFMRLDGEIPSMVDTNRIISITTNLRKFLQAEGYWDPKVNYAIQYKEKTAKVHYTLAPGRRYYLKTYELLSSDTAIIEEIDRLPGSSTNMKPGVPVTEKLHVSETKRIVLGLRNRGYYDISRSNMSRFIARDTSDQQVDAVLTIQPGQEDSVFRIHTIGNIYIYPGYSDTIDISEYRDSVIGNYIFRSVYRNLVVKPQAIIEKLNIRPGDTYSYDQYIRTLRLLNTLTIFRAPRIVISSNPEADSVLDYHIQLRRSPQHTKYGDAGGNLVSIARNQLLYGFSGNAGLQNRNLNKKSNILDLNFGASFLSSGQGIDSTSRLNFTTFQVNANIRSPRYRDLGSLSLLRLIPGIRHWLLTDETMEEFESLGETNVAVGLMYETATPYFKQFRVQASRGVTLNSGRHSVELIFQNLDLIIPDTLERFGDIATSEFFRRSFQPQLMTNLILPKIRYRYSSRRHKNYSYGIFYSLEVSGLEYSAINALIGNIIPNLRWFNNKEITFSQFVRTEFDLKYSYYFNDKQTLALRLNGGLAVPFDEANQVPYNQLFSVGGAYSLRAWRFREVGPGKVNESEANVPFVADQLLLQTGAEYRFDLGWILEGALFADAGNVWSLSDPNDAPGPQRRFSWESIAINTGLGMRLDLQFLLFRLDLAFPVRNWYADGNDNHWVRWDLGSWRGFWRDRDPRLQIGVNYPF